MKKAALYLIRLYQYAVSPFLPRACRYEPTCSHYARQAIQKHGFFRGAFLGLIRILRCNPFFRGGFDPVPSKEPRG